ncbi:hypothetical protein [Sphingomonas pokkalii]|nr:hypothetical protein [Sphingomonas pokkalii]
MFSLIALYFAHRRLAGEAVREEIDTRGAAVAANEQDMVPLPLAA